MLDIYDGPDLPKRISFTVSCRDRYWRAGILLANEQYDPQRNRITDGILVHLGHQDPETKPNLWVYVSSRRPRQTLSLDRLTPSYIVRIDLEHSEGVMSVSINGVDQIQLLRLDTRKWCRRVFLVAWADQKEFEVDFRQITVE